MQQIIVLAMPMEINKQSEGGRQLSWIVHVEYSQVLKQAVR
jgi:hypothetical protein